MNAVMKRLYVWYYNNGFRHAAEKTEDIYRECLSPHSLAESLENGMAVLALSKYPTKLKRRPKDIF